MSSPIAFCAWRMARLRVLNGVSWMRNKVIFVVSAFGLVLALVSAFIFSRQPAAQPPLFKPAANPYARGIYSNGMIESDQAQGANINIYPEVSGPITQILAAEGQSVHKGDPL